MNDIYGKKLGRYILLNKIGEGGMASVYNAFDPRDEKNVAIKVILPSKHSSDIFIKLFENEAIALANLNHTNIVKVLDYGLDDGQPFLVMDYIFGGTLKEAMKEAFPWEIAASILAPIARALDYIHKHENKIVHRDVKPSNILIDESYNSFLSDFGIIKLLESKDEMENIAIGVGVGTPEYMSPEQGMGKQVDFRADIYSLGLVFYEMVTGKKAHQADSPMAVVIKHVTDEIKRPSLVIPNIPFFVEQAILKATQKDPEKRYKSMEEFAEVLEMISLGERAPQKEIIKKIGYKKKILKPILISVSTLFSVIFLIYFLLSYFRAFQIYNIPILSVYELGTLVAVDSVDHSLLTVTPNFLSTPTRKEDVDNPSISLSLVPTKVETSTPQISNTPTPKPTLIADDLNIKFLGTPFASLNKSNRSREIAKWGVGGGNEVEWSKDGSKIGIATTNGVYIYNSKGLNLDLYLNIEEIATSISFSNDGSMIAVGSINGEVSIWDLESGKLVSNIKMVKPISMRTLSDSFQVNSVEYTPDDQFLAICYKNGVINYFSMNNQSNILAVEQYPGAYDIEISQDQKFLYVANGQNTIYKWDIEKKQKVDEFYNHSFVKEISLSKDGSYLLAAGSQNAVYLWDIISERIIYSFSDLGAPVGDVDFSNNDQFAIIGLENGNIKIYKIPSYNELFENATEISSLEGNQDKINSISYSPVSDQFASSSWDNSLVIWDFYSSEELFHLDYSMKKINMMYFSPLGDWLVTSHDESIVRVWDVDQATLLYEFDGYLPKGYPFSPDNKLLVIGNPKQINFQTDQLNIISRNNGNIITSLSQMNSQSMVKFSEDSMILAVGNIRSAILWDVTTWEKLKLLNNVTKFCGHYITPQSELLSIISEAGIYFEDNQKILEMCGVKPQGSFLKYYFQDKNTMVFVLGDGSIWTWNFQRSGYSSANMATTILDSDDFFIAGDEKSGYYAASSNGNLQIKKVGTNTNLISIPGQNHYKYRVAFSSEKGIFALGSQFGDIQIWTMQN